ncbi:diguanylate cyclase/phosphodiesterase with PAS/PAC sensor(s) [Pseudonocardia ammonioxydans]|uniref:Diguanylate cyclase/phosphodiesterase with PAS/PAC sensor(S) n=1 Tax=Pseudonocardia ammonioxydans TaxID=260086 RepID=A0A1I4WHA2_PSUAM|nr:GGDEF domain-containing phosphodiesterase [Pseudonocardia ammonioxydans]SFN12797.1 diguanylate cyclase/phosphodiesterase with PAS/PAC sensor(s) [Pseudonocardia ammonioxydans]
MGDPVPARPGGAPDRGVEQLTEAWVATIHTRGFVSAGRAELHSVLSEAAWWTAAVVDGRADIQAAADVGASLVAAHLTDPAALRCSLDVLSSHFGDRIGDPARLRRFTAAVGALSAGYARTLQERTRTEQDRISTAAFAARSAAENARWRSEARYGAVFENTALGISVSDIDGQVLEANRALTAMLGYRPGELVGRSVFEFIHPEDTPEMWPQIEAMLEGRVGHVRMEKSYFRKDGEQVWTQLVVSLIRDPEGSPRYLVAMVEDVTERHRLQSRLRHQAEHDPLTGLPNRALFFTRLTAALDDGADPRVGVCYLDLDGFKAVNDTLGHDAGDQLLTTVARRLDEVLGTDGHTVARMGGDEFVVLVEHCTGVEQLTTMAGRALDVVRRPVALRGREVVVTASIGVVAWPVPDDEATRPADGPAAGGSAELMQAADTTMYWAKRDGRDRIAVFDPVRHSTDVHLFDLAGRMPGALDRGEFELAYQPLVSFADGRTVGVEALARWRTADGEVLGPDVFIPLAEQTGLIVPLGLHLLERACTDARSWVGADPDREFSVSVNIAGRQLRRPDAVERIAEVLDRTGWPAHALQLELTESDLMAAGGRPTEALEELSRLGVRIAIDDFGTGYSNLAYLHRLPVDVLKLAGSFVSPVATTCPEAGRDIDSPVILSAMIDLAHSLGLQVVAESVETVEQGAHLRSLGCDVGQGWLIAPPLPPEEVPPMLDRKTEF